MATVRRSPHRWWVLLVAIAGSMPAVADASAHEIESKIGAGIACRTATDVTKRSQVGPPLAVRVLSHFHVRVTRLQNGSILCCRDLPSAHSVVVPWDDDTASDGDDTSDCDDSLDDHSGNDDTDSPDIAWPYTTFPAEIAPDCAVVTLWVFPFFDHFLTFQPLRC
jgi:hypothetical protein